MRESVPKANDAMGACHCDDEFKKKDCRDRAELSRKGMTSLLKGRVYRYRDQLFYVVAGFDYGKLDAKTAAGMVGQLEPELGPPASQKKVMQAGKSTIGTEVTWDSGPTAARLTFFQPNYSDPADVVLHVVDAAAQERIEKSTD
jgi:hypothetical protein